MILDTVKSPGFLLKVVALLLILPVCLWWFVFLGGSKRTDPLPGIILRGEWLWIGYTVPAYMVILPITLVLYLLEKPGPWYHRMLFISGIVFFLTTGFMVLRAAIAGTPKEPNAMKDALYHPYFFVLVCFLVSVVFFVDGLDNEGVLEFCILALRKSKNEPEPTSQQVEATT